MAERLGRGLQSLVQRFESARRLSWKALETGCPSVPTLHDVSRPLKIADDGDEDELESSQAWLEKLQELNAVVAAAGEPLFGNLFYDHLQEGYVGSAPNAILRHKRDRFQRAIKGRSRLLEVGVNGGHSAYLALTSNQGLEFCGVDVCEHAYVRPAVRWLQQSFPGRVFFHEGDSRDVLPTLRRQGLRFDAFHIDGAKENYASDLLNCQGMTLPGGAVVVVDDTQQDQVSKLWERCLRHRRIRRLQAFESMPRTTKYRNEIGLLEPEPAWRMPISRILLALGRL